MQQKWASVKCSHKILIQILNLSLTDQSCKEAKIVIFLAQIEGLTYIS